MPKIKNIKDIEAENTVVSPTQIQMDNWLALELSDNADEQMLEDDEPKTIFNESNSESID